MGRISRVEWRRKAITRETNSFRETERRDKWEGFREPIRNQKH